MFIISRSNCVKQHLVSSHSVSGRPVHRTATYIVWRYHMLYNTVWPPDDEHNSAWNMYRNTINSLKTRMCVLSWSIAKIRSVSILHLETLYVCGGNSDSTTAYISRSIQNFWTISRYSYNAFFLHTKLIMSVMRSNSESTDPKSINYLIRNLHYVSLCEHHFVHIDIKFNINFQKLFLYKFHERC